MATMAQTAYMAEGDKSLPVAYMNHTELVHSAQILYRMNARELDGKVVKAADVLNKDPPNSYSLFISRKTAFDTSA